MRTKMINRRKELNLTQEEVAIMINKSRTTYTSYELGTISPPLEVILKLKEIFKTKNDDIFLNYDVTYND